MKEKNTMKTILFTLLSVGEKYSKSCQHLVEELLSNTPHDILISTDNVEYFPNYSKRVTIRQNIEKKAKLSLNGYEFNYNLKFHAFKNIPAGYDIILYLDCDIKNKFWSEESDNKLKDSFTNHDFIACRLNCNLNQQMAELNSTGNCLFKEKMSSYNVNEWEDKSLYESKLPSEHFLGFKYDKNKLTKFYKKWRELNYQLQLVEGAVSCQDGFEIGVAAFYAGYKNSFEFAMGDQHLILGFEFNGNKI
jgi:hypothetical protein